MTAVVETAPELTGQGRISRVLFLSEADKVALETIAYLNGKLSTAKAEYRLLEKTMVTSVFASETLIYKSEVARRSGLPYVTVRAMLANTPPDSPQHSAPIVSDSSGTITALPADIDAQAVELGRARLKVERETARLENLATSTYLATKGRISKRLIARQSGIPEHTVRRLIADLGAKSGGPSAPLTASDHTVQPTT